MQNSLFNEPEDAASKPIKKSSKAVEPVVANPELITLARSLLSIIELAKAIHAGP